MRSGSVRSCPRQLHPHLEMTLVYCSRDFSTLRSLYSVSSPVSTGVSLQKVVPLGIHTNVNTYAAVSYWPCFVFFCRRFWRFFMICFLSPSCAVRCLLLQFVCCFPFVGRFPMCLAQDTGLYLCCQFHAQFRFMLARFKFHFSFCGCPFFSSSSGMVI